VSVKWRRRVSIWFRQDTNIQTLDTSNYGIQTFNFIHETFIFIYIFRYWWRLCVVCMMSWPNNLLTKTTSHFFFCFLPQASSLQVENSFIKYFWVIKDIFLFYEWTSEITSNIFHCYLECNYCDVIWELLFICLFLVFFPLYFYEWMDDWRNDYYSLLKLYFNVWLFWFNQNLVSTLIISNIIFLYRWT
jgi:hypothetical protein